MLKSQNAPILKCKNAQMVECYSGTLPFVPPHGVNTGVMLLHGERFRKSNFLSDVDEAIVKLTPEAFTKRKAKLPVSCWNLCICALAFEHLCIGI